MQTLTCATCGAEAKVELPDDGTASAWECFECGARNEVEGEPLVGEVTIAPGEREREPVEGEVISVADGDSGVSGDSTT